MKKEFLEYQLMHNFMFPEEPLKGWILETNFSNHYNKDWNPLMEVVIKINTIDDYRFTVNIQSMDVQIQDHLEGGNVIGFFSGESTDKLINSVYTACVQFIKWYNNEKANL